MRSAIAQRQELGTPAPVHHHPRQPSEYNVRVLVEVEHVDGAHLSGGAAWPDAVVGGHLHEVDVSVVAHRHVGAVPRAVVRLVLLGGDDEVVAELLEVDDEGVPTAVGLVRRLVAVEVEVATGATLHVPGHDFDERSLKQQKTTLERPPYWKSSAKWHGLEVAVA